MRSKRLEARGTVKKRYNMREAKAEASFGNN